MTDAAAPRLFKVPSLGAGGFHDLAYAQWGNGHEKERVAVCLHGLARNGRDFDAVARDLARQYRVACPDLPGRGRSDWLSNPALYAPPTYLADMAALIARLGVTQLDWIGTSLGGLIGMMLAAQPGTPIRRLVVNDVGPLLPAAGLNRIGGYISADPAFDGLDALEAYLREIYAPFGALSDAQWRHLAEHSTRRDAEGRLRLHFDPGIGAAYATALTEDVDLWAVWDAITCPVLVLRGAESDILNRDTAQEMTRRGPGAKVVEVPGVGHAPALMDPAQIALVRAFLTEADPSARPAYTTL
ncbi:MAG: alpha/beta hydrolase [Rhodobacterales bacterium]|nr:alpha/beta hydrolase [Rhodobacterales bacterium]